MKRIFISYRRHDSKYQARMIYASFEQAVTRDNVFMDVDSIPPGANFRKILKGWVDECDVLLALIGPGWIDASDPTTGARRLDNPSDFVRIEIGEALARDIPVVPVLLDGAPLPHPDQLPPELAELCDRQAEFVEYRTFDADVARLIKKLGLGASSSPSPRSRGEGRASSASKASAAGEGEGQRQAVLETGAAPKLVAATHPVSASRPVSASHPVSAPHPDPLPVRTGRGDDVARFESEARIKVDALTIFSKRGEPPLHRNGGVWLKPGAGETEWFRDLDIGPEMVVVPGAGDIPSFAIGRFTVTFAEWDAAQAHAEWQKHSGIDPRAANDHGGGRGRQPAIDVSWNDAKAYCKWLSAVTGKTYRLPSVAEWKHACRAGTMTEFWWGNEISDDLANFRRSKVGTLPVDSFSPNPWGLYQVFGNVWEWCEDPFGGSLSYRSTRGGSYHSARGALKEGAQFFSRPNDRADDIGIRVARTL